jgi:hypothetical protein
LRGFFAIGFNGVEDVMQLPDGRCKRLSQRLPPGSPVERARQSITKTIRAVVERIVKPQTTYYYWVTSMGGNGTNDGVKSAVNKFTTPARGQRIVADAPPSVPQSN